MNDWLILSHMTPGPARLGPAARLDRGLFTLEFQLPLSQPTVLVDGRVRDGGENTFSVLYDPAAGLAILDRQGASLCRYLVPGPLPGGSGTARLTLHLDAEGVGVWLLRLEMPGAARPLKASGKGSQALHLGLMDQLCARAEGSHWHPSVLWFGLSRAGAMPPRRPWIGRNTPVMTNRGPVAAEQLRPGDHVKVLDHGLRRLEAIERAEVPSRGTYAPVLLRTPYFGLSRDILVSSDQMVLVGGASVEYVCGCEEVLIRASAMVNGRTAMLENRRASTLGIGLDFGAPVLLQTDGMALLIPSAASPRPLPRRALADYEAHPLLPIIGAGSVRVSA